jgi:hypothetical protein
MGEGKGREFEDRANNSGDAHRSDNAQQVTAASLTVRGASNGWLFGLTRADVVDGALSTVFRAAAALSASPTSSSVITTRPAPKTRVETLSWPGRASLMVWRKPPSRLIGLSRHAPHDARKTRAQSSSAALAVSSTRPMVMNPWIMSG